MELSLLRLTQKPIKGCARKYILLNGKYKYIYKNMLQKISHNLYT